MELNSNEKSYVFGISQKAIIYNPNQSKFLLLKVREKGYFFEKYGPWELAGGTLKAGENLEESLKREIKEEVGEINYEIVGLVSSEKIINSSGKEKIFLGYLVNYLGEKIKISDEHSEYKWESYENIQSSEEYKPWLKKFIKEAQKRIKSK